MKAAQDRLSCILWRTPMSSSGLSQADDEDKCLNHSLYFILTQYRSIITRSFLTLAVQVT